MVQKTVQKYNLTANFIIKILGLSVVRKIKQDITHGGEPRDILHLTDKNIMNIRHYFFHTQ